MSMTEEQKKEAILEYITARLDKYDLDIQNTVNYQTATIAAARASIKEAQERCRHPLIARETENEGSSDNWDRSSYYWTNHHCIVCGLKWRTNQSWKQVGTKLGLPTDEEARDY